MKYADSVTNKFQQYSSPAWRDAYANTQPDKFLDYQDPTYIGFYVKFYGLEEKPVGAENVVGLDEWPGGLFFHEDHPNSAIRYLINIGEYTRAQMLKEFISGIKQVSEEMPWYFTKVSGLEESWKINVADSYRGKEKKITFDTLESIDLKITYLLDLYRKAVFDSVYMRYMLPENLRMFEMDVVVTEIRNIQRPAAVLPYTNDSALTQDANNFKNPIKAPPLGNINIPGLGEQGLQSAISAVVPNSTWASGLSNAVISTMARDSSGFSAYPVLMSDFNDIATYLVFSYSHCEFDAFSEAPAYFGSLEKVPNTVAANKMTINTHVIHESNTYGLLGAIVQDTLGLTDRLKDNVNNLFWKKVAADLATAVLPPNEKAYLDGIKKENFSMSKRIAAGKAIREENARLGGLLGNLLNTAIQIGAGALTNAIQNSISRAVLGNALQTTFESTISDSIANQIILTSPATIPALLTSVVLEANGASISNSVTPATITLESPEATVNSVSSVFLTGPSTVNPTPAPVPLEGPSTSEASLTSVTLEAPTLNNSPDPMVILSAPPIMAGLFGAETVSLSAPTIQTNNTDPVTLEAPLTPEPAAGKVQLEAAEAASSVPGEVIFEAPTVSTLTASTVEFNNDPIPSTASDKVELSGAEINTNISNNVELEEPVVRTTSGSDSVELEAAKTDSSVAKSVELTGASITETNPGSIQFEEVRVNGIGKTEVEFESTEISAQKPGAVQLDEPGSSDNSISAVVFEGPTITQTDPGKEDLIGPAITNAALGEISFEEATPSKAALSNVNLTGALTSKVDLESITFDETKTPAQALKNVEFNETQKETTVAGKVNLESPSPQKTELGEVKFDDVKGGSGGVKTGKVPLDAPPTHPTELGNSMDGVNVE